MTTPRNPLADFLPVMRRDEPPDAMTHAERIAWGRRAAELGITLVWDRDLPAIASAAVKTIRQRVLGGAKT